MQLNSWTANTPLFLGLWWPHTYNQGCVQFLWSPCLAQDINHHMSQYKQVRHLMQNRPADISEHIPYLSLNFLKEGEQRRRRRKGLVYLLTRSSSPKMYPSWSILVNNHLSNTPSMHEWITPSWRGRLTFIISKRLDLYISQSPSHMKFNDNEPRDTIFQFYHC